MAKSAKGKGASESTASINQQLLKALASIDRPGTFCTSGRVPAMLPGLEVEGVGPVALPLGKSQAAVLKKLARQAPYGKGTETLVDTEVRRVWEIEADQVTFANPDWAGAVEQAVQTVQAELGLQKQKLNAHLYKLLVYEKGSFFLTHRDGEKLDGMVATLVIALPSKHAGGELVVRHEDREVTVDFALESEFQTQFAAFYADCEHEVRPVKSGFRLALVYNLTLTKSKRVITAPTSGGQIAAVVQILAQWEPRTGKTQTPDAAPSPSKLAVILDHKYTEAGLAFETLKGVDRVKANVLFVAAAQSEYDAALALVTYWESGSAEPSGDYGYDYGRRGRYKYGYDDDDHDEEEDGEHEMGEVFDESLTAEHFSDIAGNTLAYGQIPLQEVEIVSAAPIDEGKPDTEDFEGYTGNAGMTLERWYHRAAIVLWPAASRFDVLCESGVDGAVGGLEQMLSQSKKATKSEQPAIHEQCRAFAGRIIGRWPAREYCRPSFDDHIKPKKNSLLRLLEKLGDVSLISDWCRGVLAKDASIEPGKTLGDLCQQHGWATFQDQLLDLFDKTSNETLERHARLLADFSLRKNKNADRKNLCAQLAAKLMSAIECWTPKKVERNWEARDVDRAAMLSPLVKSFIAVEEFDLFQRLVTCLIGRPNDFDLTTVQFVALLDLTKWLKLNVKHPCPPLQSWLAALVEQLECRVANPPQPPADWRRSSTISCKCADCTELSRFLRDPNTQILRFPLAKQRRQHLHNIIDGNKLDTTHVTEHLGSPHTLVCTKTQTSYERELQAHHVDLDQLAKLRDIVDWHQSLA